MFTWQAAQRALRNRRNMLERVNNDWINGVLEKSLYHEMIINLGLEERPDEVQLSIARPWVDNDDLLLLLDGLDEVRQDFREECVKAINDFRQIRGITPLVICCRIVDYEALAHRLALSQAIALQPLTTQQIDRYLMDAGDGLETLRQALQEDNTLRELARSPLMLSMMILAYARVSPQDLRTFDSVEARRSANEQFFHQNCEDH